LLIAQDSLVSRSRSVGDCRAALFARIESRECILERLQLGSCSTIANRRRSLSQGGDRLASPLFRVAVKGIDRRGRLTVAERKLARSKYAARRFASLETSDGKQSFRAIALARRKTELPRAMPPI
jgi:hypothetical protein